MIIALYKDFFNPKRYLPASLKNEKALTYHSTAENAGNTLVTLLLYNRVVNLPKPLVNLPTTLVRR